MTKLFEINVKLSDNQKKNLSNAYHKRETIVLRLTNDSLHGNDTLYVPAMIKKRLEKNRKLNKGMDIKLAKTNIRKQVGGSLLSTVLSLGMRALPTVGKTLGLSALSGLASEGVSQALKAITGKGQKGGAIPLPMMIPFNAINKLMPYVNMFTTKQQRDILGALQSGSGVRIKPTKTQSGGFLGTLLASIRIPMAVDVVKKMLGGSAPTMGRMPPIWSSKSKGGSAPTMGRMPPIWTSKGGSSPLMPPPFYSYPPYVTGNGKKKKKNLNQKRKGTTIGKKQSIQWHTHFGGNIVKPKFYKKTPLSNHDLIKWCKYLNIPINDVLSRDENVPHNHKQALFIYNLEPAYMSGSHWVATYVKDNVINYFDSFGMPPFQEMVNHAKKKNLTLLHQNNQIQNLKTTTCGYFCLYFLNEMNKGNSYYNLLQVFDILDTMKNERLIESYFRNI